MLTLSAIHDRLEVELARLEALVDELQEAGYQSAVTEATYRAEFAKSRLSIKATSMEKMTVGDIEAEATIACEQQHLAYLLAANNHLSVREACKACTTRVDALRSLAASFRSASG